METVESEATAIFRETGQRRAQTRTLGNARN